MKTLHRMILGCLVFLILGRFLLGQENVRIIGKTESELLAIKGTPNTKAAIGNKAIYGWDDATVTLENGIVTKVRPRNLDQEKADNERRALIAAEEAEKTREKAEQEKEDMARQAELQAQEARQKLADEEQKAEAEKLQKEQAEREKEQREQELRAAQIRALQSDIDSIRLDAERAEAKGDFEKASLLRAEITSKAAEINHLK